MWRSELKNRTCGKAGSDMAKYIKLEGAINGLENERKLMIELCDFDASIGVQFAKQYLEKDLPTIEIVHCGECRHRASGRLGKMCIGRLPDDFCSYGERTRE